MLGKQENRVWCIVQLLSFINEEPFATGIFYDGIIRLKDSKSPLVQHLGFNISTFGYWLPFPQWVTMIGTSNDWWQNDAKCFEGQSFPKSKGMAPVVPQGLGVVPEMGLSRL